MGSAADQARALVAGAFSGMKEAKVRLDSQWERQGHYIERIEKVKIDQSRKKQTGFFIEKTVLFVLDDDDAKGHKVGESITHTLWTHHDQFLGNAKAFLMCVLGEPEDKISDDHIFEVIDDDQPLVGTIIECQNRTILTKENKTPFTIVGYRREVPARELRDMLPEQDVARFYPDGLLDRLVELEEGT